MAVNEVNTLIHTKDENGNTTIHYPITKSDNVTLLTGTATELGLEDGASVDAAVLKLKSEVSGISVQAVSEHINDKNNPHDVTCAKIGAVNPNLLVNGDFQVWSKGTSITTTSADKNIADKWKCYQNNVTANRIEHGISEVNSKYALQATVPTAQSLYIYQQLENFDTLIAGKTLTVSCWAKGVGGFTGTMYVAIGLKSAGTLNLTDEWQRFEFTVENATVNAEDVRRQGVMFYSGSSNNPQAGQGWAFAEVKLEYGKQATQFIPNSVGGVVTSSIPMTLSINESGGLRITYDDGQ